MLKALFATQFTISLLLVLAAVLPLTPLLAQDDTIQRGNVGGYTGARTQGGQEEFNAGFSFYSVVWPLQREYPGHMGLHSMRERAAMLGGRLEVESSPGQGTRLVAWIPV